MTFPHEMSSLGMEQFLGLGCCFYEMYLERPQWAINETLPQYALQGTFSVMATSKAMQLKVYIHLLENQCCLDNLLQFCVHWFGYVMGDALNSV